VPGTNGGRTVDNLRVPQGATCTLNGTYVKGTIKVERAATLRAHGVRVIGNVQAENSRNVVVNEGPGSEGTSRPFRTTAAFGSVTTGSMGTSNARRTSRPRGVAATTWAAQGRQVRGSVTT
jgi:hypothetical protein